MNHKPWLTLTALIALAIGVVLAIWLIPLWRTTDRIHDVASENFDRREAAWNWWRSEPGSLPLPELNQMLADASPDALFHGARELQKLHSWGWGKQTNAMMGRYITLLMWRSHIMDLDDVILLVDQAPADAPHDAMLEIGDALFTHPDALVARRGFNALIGWCGFRPVLAPMLSHLPEHRSDWGLHYLHLLNHGQQPLRVETMSNRPTTDPVILQAMEQWQNNFNNEELLLLLWVRTAATMGDALQRRTTAQRWLDDLGSDINPEEGTTPPPGPQRRLAGALLAAHERLDTQLLEQAMIIEQDAVTRTVLRLAIDATGPTWNNENPAEFARRALPVPEGTSLYPLFCRMLAGDIALLEPLLDAAAAGSWPARFQSVALISWLMPGWIDAEPNIAAGIAEADNFFELLLARWRLEHRWVVNSRISADDVSHD
jgi:hypothetical protein